MRNLLALVVAGMALAGSSKCSDPGSSLGPGACAVCRHGTLRLADADILPYEFTGLPDTVQTHVREVQALLNQRPDEVHELNRQVTDGVFAAVRDPKRPRPISSLEAELALSSVREVGVHSDSGICRRKRRSPVKSCRKVA